MLFTKCVGDTRRSKRLISTWPCGLAILFTGFWLSDARADSADLLVQRVRNALQQHSLKRVVLAVQEENAGQAADETRADMAQLGKRLEEACRQLGIAPVTLEADGGLGDFSTTKLPDSDDISKVLKDSNADAVFAIAWKPTKTGIAIRVTLIDDRKVLWNNRTTLSRTSLKQQSAAKTKTGTSLAKGSGAFGKGSKSGSNLAGGSMLGSNLASGSTGAGSFGGKGMAGSGIGFGDNDAASQPVTGINARILEFASSQLGRQVGNGECWTLAAEALKYAGARPPVVYDFGDDVPLDELQPGDVLHFQSALFTMPNSWMLMGSPDHVAIVGKVQGTKLLIYQQNVNGDRRDQTATIDLATLSSGTIIGYRAQGRSGNSSNNMSDNSSGNSSNTHRKPAAVGRK